jgi:putative protease
VGEGADAVYLGLKNFNARMRSVNFDYARFEGALRSLHRMGRKLYVTVNTVFEQREADRMYQLLKYLSGLGPDGLIVQDFGTAAMVRTCFPSLKLHASTQMNIASSRGANALSKAGVSRVVLARELSLDEIRSCRDNTNMELEVFVHGALCISASGLCLFSSYLGGKSANRGMCTQACRRLYRSSGGEGYYFSPLDLQLLEKLPDLVFAGVNAFKIEGRMKGAEYVGAVTAAYRLMLDVLAEGAGEEKVRESIRRGLEILKGDFARTKTFFYFNGTSLPDSWLQPEHGGGTGVPLGKLVRTEGSGEDKRGLVAAGPLLPAAGDTIRLHKADDTERESFRIKFAEDCKEGRWFSVPAAFGAGDYVYLIRAGAKSRHYAPVISGKLENFKRRPGRDKAPLCDIPPVRGRGFFPEGVYAAVSRIEDLYILQSVRPAMVMLELNRKTAAGILGGNPLPFRPDETIIALDPFFPEAADKVLAGEIKQLAEMGYSRFMVNNPGHFSLLKGSCAGPALIAGPYLYIFNRWSASLVSSFGAEYFVSPLENNRQNLEKTVEHSRRRQFFVTVFAFPALFRIRADLGSMYHFEDFAGSRGEAFRLVRSVPDRKPGEPDGVSSAAGSGSDSLVYPDKPFSIVDKIPFLEKSGFRRFILDFSGPPLKKKDFKIIMTAVKNAAPLPGIVRFNWKDGFYSEEKGREF